MVFCPQHIPAGYHQGVGRGVRRGKAEAPQGRTGPSLGIPILSAGSEELVESQEGPATPHRGLVSGSHPGLGCTEKTLGISALGP